MDKQDKQWMVVIIGLILSFAFVIGIATMTEFISNNSASLSCYYVGVEKCPGIM